MIFKDSMKVNQFFGILIILLSITFCVSYAESLTQKHLEEIKKSLDPSVDPCEDFYAYACNNWEKQHTDTNYDDITGLVDYKMNMKLIKIIEKFQQQHLRGDGENFLKKSYNYYKSCINENELNITRYFDNIKPADNLEWPLFEELQAHLRGEKNVDISKWSSGQFDIFKLLGQLQGYGFNNAIISHEIRRNPNGLLEIHLQVPLKNSQDDLPLPVLMALLTGWDLSEATVRNIIQSDKEWHAIYQSYARVDKRHAGRFTYQELKQLYPKLGLYLHEVLRQEIQDHDIVTLENLEYFKYLANYDWGARENLYGCNYLMLKFLLFLIEDTTNDFTPLDCIKDLRNKMDLAANYLYYIELDNLEVEGYQRNISSLSQIMFKYFLETIYENPLKLNSEQLQQLQDKLAGVTINIGNLPKHTFGQFPDAEIEEFYQELPSMNIDNFYKNHLDLLKHRFGKSLQINHNATFIVATNNEMGSSSTPFYAAKQNMIILPLGFLQQPIYHHSCDSIFKWSLMGFLLAHKYSHAIDSQGLLQLNNALVASTERFQKIVSSSDFTASLDCLQNQKNSEASIDERLADLVAARVAFKAYEREHNNGLSTSSSSISWQQLFFLNLAQFFCGRKYEQFFGNVDNEVRLQQIAMNLESFAEAFQCPLDSKMNPREKCRFY